MASPTAPAVPCRFASRKPHLQKRPRHAGSRRHAGNCAAALLFPLAIVVGGPAAAQSARCGEQIAALASAERDLAIGLHAPQSVDAQLHHQPTPGTVADARSEAKRMHVQNVLASARRLDAQGKEAECIATLKNGGLLP